MLKGAIFDMDGTITDTERLYRDTWLELAVQYGQEPSIPFTKAVCGSNGQEMMNIISRFYPTIDAESFMNDCYATVNRKVENEVPIKEGVREALELFKSKGIKMAVASSSAHDQIEKNMKKSNLFEYFDAFVGGDEVEHSKPHPEIFHKSAERLGLKAEECYIFEDGMNGLRSGLASGGKVFMMVDLTDPDDVVAPQCAGIYDSFLDLVDAVRENNTL